MMPSPNSSSIGAFHAVLLTSPARGIGIVGKALDLPIDADVPPEDHPALRPRGRRR
jgi:hypothetical protein